MKVSVITVTLNAESYLEDCILSVIRQDYADLEYILVDGGSTDGTIAIIERYRSCIHHFISESDESQYDALNKGISLATGDVVGILNADDYFPEMTVIGRIARAFECSGSDVVYGDLDYVSRDRTNRVTRRWRSGLFDLQKLRWGWMPPHPTWYVKKPLLFASDGYRPRYATSSDYELILRVMNSDDIRSFYLEGVLVKMRAGGRSNFSIANRLHAAHSDLQAIRDNGLRYPLLVMLMKRLMKLPQFFLRN